MEINMKNGSVINVLESKNNTRGITSRKLRGHYIYQIYDKGKYKYFFCKDGYCFGELAQNFDWQQLEHGVIIEYFGSKYIIDKIFDDENNEAQEAIVYRLKSIVADIALGFK